MTSLSSQPASNDSTTSVWAALLSGSIVLAVMTGVLYLVGGAWYLGSSYALGLNYLTGLQPNEYIFEGGQLLLGGLLVLTLIVALVAVAFVPLLALCTPLIKDKLSSRCRESLIFFLSVFSEAILLLWFIQRVTSAGCSLTKNGACPIQHNHIMYSQGLFIVGTIFALASTPLQLFWPRYLRFSFSTCSTIYALVALYFFGWSSGAERLYESFQVAEVTSPSLVLGNNTKVLLLGSDNQSLVVLVPGETSDKHPEPHYLLRSDVKSFRLTGTSSINDFFCKQSKVN